MNFENDIALTLSENEILLRRNHLRAVADELAERVGWLEHWLPSGQATTLPPNDWPVALEEERLELMAARAALLTRRAAQVRAQEAALLLWQMQLDTVAELVRERERAHRQPPPTPRMALNRNVEAPELAVEQRRPPGSQADTWQVALDLPAANLESRTQISRGRTVTMTAAELDAADRATLSRANKRRTARMSPVAALAPDREPAATPHDLPTIAPVASAARHRGRSVTEPFLAALDLDGLYLKRQQVTLDVAQRLVRVHLEDAARHADHPDMPAQPERLTYRSREGETRFFGLKDAQLQSDANGHWLVLDVQHWKHEELHAFHDALAALP